MVLQSIWVKNKKTPLHHLKCLCTLTIIKEHSAEANSVDDRCSMIRGYYNGEVVPVEKKVDDFIMETPGDCILFIEIDHSGLPTFALKDSVSTTAKFNGGKSITEQTESYGYIHTA